MIGFRSKPYSGAPRRAIHPAAAVKAGREGDIMPGP